VSGFDINDHLDGLRCRETAWLRSRRDELVREQRRLHVEELAVLRVLDERRAVAPDLAAHDGISERSLRSDLETARALESLPELAAAAHDGRLSAEQLAPVAQLAREDTDHEWAGRAAHVAPVDLARLARTQRAPSRQAGLLRREARTLRKWWDHDRGMFCGRFELADVDGAFVESVLDELVERMRPAQGQAWDTRDHRYADALVQVCRAHDQVDPHQPTLAAPVRVHVQIPLEGAAEVGGVALPEEWVTAARAQAQIELTVTDGTATTLASGRPRSPISDRRRSAVVRRDGHCRWPGCERRLGLQVHHLVPVSRGGGDDLTNLAAICPAHHALMIPHGNWVLAGNPNQPDGLHLLRADDDRLKGIGVATGAGARAGP
jgi:hypothetical protein